MDIREIWMTEINKVLLCDDISPLPSFEEGNVEQRRVEIDELK